MQNWSKWISGFISGALVIFVLLGVLPASVAEQDLSLSASALDAFQHRLTKLENESQQDYKAIQDLYKRVAQVNSQMNSYQQNINAQMQQFSSQQKLYQQQIDSQLDLFEQSIKELEDDLERLYRIRIYSYPYHNDENGQRIYKYYR